ncbi:MAG: hypothetical protein M1291_07000, partial [Thaumarchaeota archaeon]|nr:hypothetical protein [Nitrososphaerota archaeon]
MTTNKISNLDKNKSKLLESLLDLDISSLNTYINALENGVYCYDNKTRKNVIEDLINKRLLNEVTKNSNIYAPVKEDLVANFLSNVSGLFKTLIGQFQDAYSSQIHIIRGSKNVDIVAKKITESAAEISGEKNIYFCVNNLSTFANLNNKELNSMAKKYKNSGLYMKVILISQQNKNNKSAPTTEGLNRAKIFKKVMDGQFDFRVLNDRQNFRYIVAPNMNLVFAVKGHRHTGILLIDAEIASFFKENFETDFNRAIEYKEESLIERPEQQIKEKDKTLNNEEKILIQKLLNNKGSLNAKLFAQGGVGKLYFIINDGAKIQNLVKFASKDIINREYKNYKFLQKNQINAIVAFMKKKCFLKSEGILDLQDLTLTTDSYTLEQYCDEVFNRNKNINKTFYEYLINMLNYLDENWYGSESPKLSSVKFYLGNLLPHISTVKGKVEKVDRVDINDSGLVDKFDEKGYLDKKVKEVTLYGKVIENGYNIIHNNERRFLININKDEANFELVKIIPSNDQTAINIPINSYVKVTGNISETRYERLKDISSDASSDLNEIKKAVDQAEEFLYKSLPNPLIKYNKILNDIMYIRRSSKCIHGDLHPRNIIVYATGIKLIDLGSLVKGGAIVKDFVELEIGLKA